MPGIKDETRLFRIWHPIKTVEASLDTLHQKKTDIVPEVVCIAPIFMAIRIVGKMMLKLWTIPCY